MKIQGIEIPRWGWFAAVALLLTLVLAVLTSPGGSRSRSDEEGERAVVVTRHSRFNLPSFSDNLTNEGSEFEGIDRWDRDMRKFMSYWHLRGVSLAVMRNDSLLFVRGYGYADSTANVEMRPSHILRVASVSKLITAAGVMVLKDQRRLRLSDKVFDPREGILRDEPYCQKITDRRYYDITVEQLLRHEGGFSEALGDPMFTTLSLMRRNGLTSPPTPSQLMETQLENRLRYTPGTTKNYSNYGYFILSLIIEKVSGQSYEDFIQTELLQPAGCYGFRLAENYYEQRYPNEVRYYLTKDDTLLFEYTGSGRKVPRCYGGNDIRGLQGAGAWVASPAELARLVASIDGRPGVPDVLSKESVREMTRSVNGRYSLGWNETDPKVGWVRTGTLSGTSALIKYFPDGECWIMVTNTSTWIGPRFSKQMAAKFSEWRRSWSAKLPKQNLFVAGN